MKRSLFALIICVISLLSGSCENKFEINDSIGTTSSTNSNTQLSAVSSLQKDQCETHVSNHVIKPVMNFEDNEAQLNIDSIAAYIPEGWNILNAFGNEVVEGDLNNDNVSDIAFVIECADNSELDGNRALMILIDKGAGNYDLSVKAEKVIRRKDEGGFMGEAFMGLKIEDGTLEIDHYGGSAWRWSTSHTFKFINNRCYLIESIEDWFHAVSNKGRRYNEIHWLSGDFIRIETDENSIETQTKGNQGEKPLINIIDFDGRL